MRSHLCSILWFWLCPSCFPSQVGSIAGAVLIVIIAVVGGILYKGSWVITPKLWIIGTIFPAAGYTLGFFLARLSGLSWHRYSTALFNCVKRFYLIINQCWECSLNISYVTESLIHQPCFLLYYVETKLFLCTFTDSDYSISSNPSSFPFVC